MAFTTENYPGVESEPDQATTGFALNHTMLRIKDPARSLAFYTGVMGMRVLRRLDFSELNFSLYFLAHSGNSAQPPEDTRERTAWTFSQQGVLELTHNWGTENDESVQFHNGNDEPQGFGHICISVPDLDTAIKWFDKNAVEYIKRPEQGKLKDIAFIKDPDGYWIEVIEPRRLKHLGD